MAEVKLRYNPDSEEVEFVVDGEVALSSGTAEFASWVEHYNGVHPPEPVEPEVTEEDKLRAEVEDLKTQLEVARAAAAPVEQETPSSDESVAEVDSDESV